jgi:hypothetical protein
MPRDNSSGPEKAPPAYPPGSIPGPSKLVVAGYILAVVFPIAGFIIGIVIVKRADNREVKHGIWMMVISVFAALVLFVGLIVSSGGAGNEDEDSIRAPVASSLPSPRGDAVAGPLGSIEVFDDLIRA